MVLAPEFNSLQREDPQVSKTRKMQRRDVELNEIIDFLESDVLPFDDRAARKVLLTSNAFYFTI